ncbi:putative band 3 anion transport protein isoform X1 [Apostichopus japonicus]|uniref:Anion exchange protein n=1 Tax=Stichopus japonicus TaxID=307972 RepID=A0A2G8LGI7_STIJA|nr:putative band 3 anion transport protein isoform X1 [Apostichopus japonicus]
MKLTGKFHKRTEMYPSQFPFFIDNFWGMKINIHLHRDTLKYRRDSPTRPGVYPVTRCGLITTTHKCTCYPGGKATKSIARLPLIVQLSSSQLTHLTRRISCPINLFTIGDPDLDDDNLDFDQQESMPIIPKVVVEDPSGQQVNTQGAIAKDHHHRHHHKHHHRDRDGKHHHHHKRHHGHHSHHHHHHHHRQYMDPLDLSLRSQQGSLVDLGKLEHSGVLPTEEDEAILLNQADLEEMTTHRFGHVPGMSRPKVRRSLTSFIHVASKSGSEMGSASESEVKKPLKYKKKRKKSVQVKPKYDHRPHEVFVELDELYKKEGHEMQWKESARWIKFEEDVEEGAQKWGRPHVASLSFHSLVELRQYLEGACCLLDLEETDLPNIFHRLTDQMIISDQARDEDRGQILRTLLLKHKHLQDRPGLLKNISTVSLGSLLRHSHSEANLKHHNHKERNFSVDHTRNVSVAFEKKEGLRRLATEPANMNGTRDEVHIPMLSPESNDAAHSNNSLTVSFHPSASASSIHHGSHSEPKQLDAQHVEGIMKKIPEDAEATTVLVGELDSLRKPAVVFVRLAEGTKLGNLTEVPIPVRFLFVMLGPGDYGVDYHEIGRSFSTLMSNEHFHEVAYKADSIDDLLDAMNDFIDHTIVLPPGNWDKDLLLPVLRMQQEKMMDRKKLLETPTIMEEDEDIDETDAAAVKKADELKDDDPLERTGRLFGGMIKDIKRRYPKYLSDIKDGLNPQCLAAFVFIYFACLSPAITFGGLLGEKSDNWMGVSEMILGSSISGVIFSLFSAQPLTIIGSTGPILVFEENLYQFCVSTGIEYLPYRAWVGIWLFVIVTVVVAFEGSTLVRYFTRFTEEIFAFLISLIFIFEVFNKLSRIFQEHPLDEPYCSWMEEFENSTSVVYEHTSGDPTSATVWNNGNGVCSSDKEDITNQPNTALLSTILTIGTFLLAYFLRMFRNSRFLGRGARKMIGDFGIPISILVMCLVDYFLQVIYTEKLEVPDGLQPTDSCKRGWWINPLGIEHSMNPLMMLSAVIPALLAFILMYMETLITGLIINKKENKLKKGSGFHLDLFILGGLACFNGLFGLPWVWAATVRSVTLGALSIFSKSNAPGEKPHLEGIREQRVTAFLVNVMIGLSLALAPLLSEVPLAVLFGVFLYMGVSSLSGIQMVDRTKLIFMPTKHYPDVVYVRKVRSYRMHFFTILQLICLAVLWVVKISAAALAFPFFLILLVPVRMVLPKIFKKQELDALDSSEAADLDQEDDEYQEAHMPI